MKIVSLAAVGLVGGVMALGAAPAQAAEHSKWGGYGSDGNPGGTVERTVSPQTCAPEYNAYANQTVNKCVEGWTVKRTLRKRAFTFVRTDSEFTTTATAPGLSFQDITDTADNQVYKRGDLVYEYKYVVVHYTPAFAPPCTRTIVTVTDHGATSTDDESDCTVTPAALAA